MNQQEEMVMTVKEVFDYLRLGKSTVYKLVQEGELPGRKVGGTWRFSRVGLEEWLRNASVDVIDKNDSSGQSSQ